MGKHRTKFEQDLALYAMTVHVHVNAGDRRLERTEKCRRIACALLLLTTWGLLPMGLLLVLSSYPTSSMFGARFFPVLPAQVTVNSTFMNSSRATAEAPLDETAQRSDAPLFEDPGVASKMGEYLQTAEEGNTTSMVSSRATTADVPPNQDRAAQGSDAPHLDRAFSKLGDHFLHWAAPSAGFRLYARAVRTATPTVMDQSIGKRESVPSLIASLPGHPQEVLMPAQPSDAELRARCGELPSPAARGRRLQIVSTGGVGTTELMQTMRPLLEPLGVELNDVNDIDGLKHPWLSECTLHRVRRFGPTAIIYVLGDPAAAIYSHFRRGWAGSQMCRLTPEAEVSLQDPELSSIMTLNGWPPSHKKRTARAESWEMFTRWIASNPGAKDPFGIEAHALSWLHGAADLHAPVWFTTLADFAVTNSTVLGLLDLPPDVLAKAPVPLFTLKLREPSYRPDGVPQGFIDMYARVRDSTMRLQGLCYEAGPGPSRCEAAGLLHKEPSRTVVLTGTGTGMHTEDSQYHFFMQTQVREGSACWKLMRHSKFVEPRRLQRF
jgi:hypothetical protein